MLVHPEDEDVDWGDYMLGADYAKDELSKGITLENLEARLTAVDRYDRSFAKGMKDVIEKQRKTIDAL